MLRASLAELLPDLRAFARFLTNSRSEADDVVQEAVLRVLNTLDKIEDGPALRPWCFGILRNVVHESRRQKQREAAHAADMALQQERYPSQFEPGDLRDLSEALQALPSLLHEAVLLVGAHGLSYEEAAIICKVPVGTMKARVSRARTLLAAALAAVTG